MRVKINRYPRICISGSVKSASFLSVVAVVISTILCGCHTVRPEADYQRVRDLVADRTGIDDTYQPAVEPMIRQKTDALIEDGITADESVRIALLNNSSFQSLFGQIGVARADLVQSGLFTNPSLSLSMIFLHGGSARQLSGGPVQELVDLWQIPVRKDIAKQRLEQTVLDVVASAVDLASRCEIAYWRFAAMQEAKTVVHRDLALLKKTLDMAQARFDAGETSMLDVNLARSTLVDERMRLAEIERDERTARVDLAEVMGIDVDRTDWTITDSIPRTGHMAVSDAELLEYAVNHRLDLQVADYDVRVAESESRLQRRSVFPSLGLGLESELDEGGGYEMFLGPSVDMTIPLFDQNQAQIAKARFELWQKQKQLEQQTRTVARDVLKDAAVVRGSEKLLNLFKTESIPLAKKNIDISANLYRAGETDILTVVDSQRTFIQRQKAYVFACMDYAIALSELKRSVGGGFDGRLRSIDEHAVSKTGGSDDR